MITLLKKGHSASLILCQAFSSLGKKIFFVLFFIAAAGISNAADHVLTSGVPFDTSLAAGSIATNLYIEVPDGASKLTVAVTNGTGDLDLYLKYGLKLQGSTVNQLDADTDLISDGPTPNEQIVVTSSSNPPLRAGRWYIGVLNWNSSTTHFTVTATVEMPSGSASQSGNSAELSKNLFSNVKDLEANMYLSGLSPSQEAFVREWGYPQSFSKIIRKNDNQIRIDEIWFYNSKGVCENFINGIFIEETEITDKNPDAPPGNYKPENYSFNTRVQDIINMHGNPLLIKKENIGADEVKLYVYDEIIFGFLNGEIVHIMTNIHKE